MSRDLSVVVPAFNEGDNLYAAVLAVLVSLRQAGIAQYEAIVVDDGSTDHTAAVADALARQCVDVRVIHHPTNLGLRAAYESGLSVAQFEHVTWAPGDGEMAARSLVDIFSAVGSADLVIPYHGTPERRAWFRRLLTWGSTTQLNWLLGHDLHYFQGTVVYPTDLARRLPRTVPGFFCVAEMLAHAMDEGLSYVQIPLEHVERSSGVSKAVSWRAIWAAQKHIVRVWWRLRVVQPCSTLLVWCRA